ncbi:hypothetical protein RCO27_00515 [Sphingosinicella sp. LHD-64]|nr:hypothetical protein [Sphingosinicella sp. LHD-64]MDQ8754700.1 hypothetical protein [Sphingosinicella sp. LHD-64]
MDVQMRLGRIARIADLPEPLADGDAIARRHRDAALPEMGQLDP